LALSEMILLFENAGFSELQFLSSIALQVKLTNIIKSYNSKPISLLNIFIQKVHSSSLELLKQLIQGMLR